jgi:hypothetical protein
MPGRQDCLPAIVAPGAASDEKATMAQCKSRVSDVRLGLIHRAARNCGYGSEND